MCGLKERKRSSVAHAAADLIGAAQLIHLKAIEGFFSEEQQQKSSAISIGDAAKADFMAQEYRLLFMIDESDPHYESIKEASKNLGTSAEKVDYWGKHLKIFQAAIKEYLRSQGEYLVDKI